MWPKSNNNYTKTHATEKKWCQDVFKVFTLCPSVFTSLIIDKNVMNSATCDVLKPVGWWHCTVNINVLWKNCHPSVQGKRWSVVYGVGIALYLQKLNLWRLKSSLIDVYYFLESRMKCNFLRVILHLINMNWMCCLFTHLYIFIQCYIRHFFSIFRIIWTL